MAQDLGLLKKEFQKRFGAGEGLGGNSEKKIRIFRAPGRINIIGENIDYNGGRVLPATIDRALFIAIRARDDEAITYEDIRFPGTYKANISDNFTYKKEDDYANYLNGILSALKSEGHTMAHGFDVLIASDLPAGSGVSSSSALECAFATAVNDLFNLGLSKKEIALLGQKSEHEFLHVQCGIMDQFVIATGCEGTAELLDCKTLECDYIPLFLGDYSFVVMDTKKPRQLSSSAYNDRRRECEAALKEIQKSMITFDGVRPAESIKSLCDLTPNNFLACKAAITDPVARKRAAHCVSEGERVDKAVKALKAGDLATLGVLLNESHESLKSDYEVTCRELDSIVYAAQGEKSCLGARMTGAGFGGCAIALVETSSLDDFIKSVDARYKNEIGHEGAFFSCKTSNGASEVELE